MIYGKSCTEVRPMAEKLRYTLMLRVYGEEKIFGPGIAELL